MQGNPPANEGYMIAAYIVAAVIILGYAVALFTRAGKALRGGRQ